MEKNKYFAFISYKHEDEEWAVWFHHELENYHLPVTLNGRADLPTEFRPVFRDIDELKAGNLPEQIYDALATSTFLVVICSPNAAKSEWVNKEIMDFIEIGNSKGIDNVRNIFPFIVDGHPHAENQEDECFPQVFTLTAHEDSAYSAVFSPDGNSVVSISLDGTVIVWDLDDESYVELGVTDEFGDGFYYAYATFSHDGNRIAFVLDNIIEVWDLRTNSLVQSIERQQLFVSMSFSDDDKKIISVFEDGELVIWDVETGQEVNKTKGCPWEVSGAAFSKDCGRVGMIVDVNNILICDINSKYIIKICRDGDDYLESVLDAHKGKKIFGKRIVSASEKVVEICDMETRKHIKTLGLNPMDYVTSDSSNYENKEKEVAFHLLDYAGHLGLIKQVEETPAAISQDERYIVSSSTDGALTIWDVESGSEVITLFGHTDAIVAINFSPDDKQIVSKSKDGTIILWDFPSLQDLIDQTRERFKDRLLTPEERRQYYLE